MQITVLGLGARGDERIPVAVGVVDRRQAEVPGQLGEADGPHAPRRVATDLVGRERGIPERDEAQRQESSARAGAPLLDHPVVVRPHAQEREVLVARLEERLPAEPREGREAQRGLDPVEVHVVEPRTGLVATRPHLVVDHRDDLHVFGCEAGARAETGVGPLEILVEPEVGEGSVVAARAHPGHVVAAAERHLRDRRAHDARADLAVLRGQAAREHVGRFDDVVVGRDDARDRGHGRYGTSQSSRWTTSSRGLRRGRPSGSSP